MDEEFRHPRLAAVYDALDADRRDLTPYLDLARRVGARRALDLACGTGLLAIALARRGLDVVGVDLAAASLDVARRKPDAERVRWVEADAADLPRHLTDPPRDLATMTGNAAMAVIDDGAWRALLGGVSAVLAPGGRFAFETRDPAARAWEGWTRAATEVVHRLEGVGEVVVWTDVTELRPPLVRFRTTWTFASDGAVLTSDSVLRFRSEDEVRADLGAAGFEVEDVRGAPDRPDRELVFTARRPA